MNKDKLTKQEELNLNSYSTDSQLKVYDDEKLKEIELPLFKRWFSGGNEKILDIGCGTGRTTKHLNQAGYDVVGVDYAPEMIRVANKKYPDIEFDVMNARRLEFDDELFDVVLFSFNGLDCIYPESGRWEAFEEMKRVLKPGGKLILSSHNSIIWPTNKYIWFWWFLNIITGKIFTPYRLEYKQYRQGIKFIYFARRPSRQLKDFLKKGFKLLDIINTTLPQKHLGSNPTKSDLRKLDLKEDWPYFVLEKND